MVLLLLFVSVFSFAAESDEIKAAIEGKRCQMDCRRNIRFQIISEQRKLRVGLIKPSAAEAGQINFSEAPLTGIPSIDA